jgi:pSer/pThr/pTyr-binding forkhead associated (FHA) protein
VAPVKAAAAPSKFALVVISGSSTGQRFRLSVQGCQVGRSRGAMLFPDDPFISPLHAAFSIREGRLHVRDEGSASGVLVTVHQELLPPGTLFAAGNHLFRYAGSLEPVPPVSGRPVVYGAPLPQALYLVEEVLVGGRAGRAVVTHGPLLTIGQSLCDLSFPNEEGMASRHCELTPTPAGATLRDLSGGLGTYVHLAGGERALNPGDRVRIGDQILQVETA